MLIISIVSFFAVIFLLAVIVVAIAWMGFVKRTTEQHQAARSENHRDPITLDLNGHEREETFQRPGGRPRVAGRRFHPVPQ